MPGRNPSQVQAFSVREFFERFPTDDSCLEHLMALRYGKKHPCSRCLNLCDLPSPRGSARILLCPLWQPRLPLR